MITPNLFSFNEGYYAQQRSDLRDAENARAQELAAQRQTLFDQQQQEFAANQALRDLQRQLGERQARGNIDLFDVQQPGRVAGAQFAEAANAATRSAMAPNIQELATLGAQTLLERARTAQTQAGVGGAQAQMQARLFNDPEYVNNLVATQQANAEMGAQKSALAALLAQDEATLLGNPRTREIARTAAQLAQETKLIDSYLAADRMDAVNQILAQRGMEAKFEGMVPMARKIGETKWEPWRTAIGLPFYSNVVRNLNTAAQAHQRDASAQNRAVAPVPNILGGVPTTPTPLAGAAQQPAPAPAAPAAPAPRPRLQATPAEIDAIMRALRQQEADAATQAYLRARNQ